MLEEPRLLMMHLRKELFKPQKENRMMNMLVVGPKGQGKSNLLHHLLHADEKNNEPNDNRPPNQTSNIFHSIFCQVIYLIY